MRDDGAPSDCPWIAPATLRESPSTKPLRNTITADVVIIGGGYTGLASAYYLMKAVPEKRVVVLEAGHVGSGASGCNDGLVLPFIDGAEAIVDRLIEKGDTEKAREVYEKTSSGIGLIEQLIRENGIDCDWEPRRCLIGALTERHVGLLEREYGRYKALGVDSSWLTAAEQQRRVNVTGYRSAITTPMGGMINPAKLVVGMLNLVRALGGEVYENSRAVNITPGKKVIVRTPTGSVSADALVLAMNAYTSALGFFRNRVLPIHSFNIATEPLSARQLETLNWGNREPFYDVRNLFELFRLTPDNRIVFSGGEVRYRYGDGLSEGGNDRAYERLERRLRRRFPMLPELAVTHRWCGHLGLTLDRAPAVGVMGPSRNVYYGLGYSGHGVPVSFLAGNLISELYTGNKIAAALDFIMNRTPPAVPPEPLRWIGFAIYKRYLQWRDSR